jgi:hypothetical protein
MAFPKQLNLYNITITDSSGSLPSANNCFLINAPSLGGGLQNIISIPSPGTYILPPISTIADGTIIVVKNISASGTATLVAAGTDSLDGGATSFISLTSQGRGLGLGCILVASRTGASNTWTWWRIVKGQ